MSGMTTTPTPSRALLSWSGGKDSALALQRAQSSGAWRIDGLLTTVTDGYDRISMHGVRTSLLQAQAAALGLPVRTVRIPPACSNERYEAAMRAVLARYAAEGGEAVLFGDLFLGEVRAYRERLLAGLPLRAEFPIWGEPTGPLARRFVDEGFRAVLVCVDPRQIDRGLAGRDYDAGLLADLPPTADPCGENGEFHTFVHDGPIFRRSVPVTRGDVVERDGFVFCDLR